MRKEISSRIRRVRDATIEYGTAPALASALVAGVIAYDYYTVPHTPNTGNKDCQVYVEFYDPNLRSSVKEAEWVNVPCDVGLNLRYSPNQRTVSLERDLFPEPYQTIYDDFNWIPRDLIVAGLGYVAIKGFGASSRAAQRGISAGISALRRLRLPVKRSTP